MKGQKGWQRSVRAACAALAVGSVFATTGCDQAADLMTLVQTTARDAVQDKAQAAVEAAVGGILGGVIPGAAGS